MVESEIKKKFEQDLIRVKDAIVSASEHRNIHYVLTNADDRPRYVNVMNCYLGFFRASISAHFTSALLTLSKVLEKNTKSNVSVYSLKLSVRRSMSCSLKQLLNRDLLRTSTPVCCNFLQVRSTAINRTLWAKCRRTLWAK